MYKKRRDKLIRTKGYDADHGIGMILSMVTAGAIFFIGFQAGGGSETQGVAVILILVAVASLAVNILLRIKPVGIMDAVVISLEQTVAMLVGAFVWFFKTICSLFGGFMGKHNAAEAERAKKQQEAERKAALMREYEASVAAIQQGSDEIADLTGETDAAVAAARDDYEWEVSKIDHEYKG